MDALRDEVALMGVAGHARAAEIVAAGLSALAHRGGEAAGLVVGDGPTFRGMWPDRLRALHEPGALAGLPGSVAIGKVWEPSVGVGMSGATGPSLSGLAPRVTPAGRAHARRPVCASTFMGPLAAAIAGRLLNDVSLSDQVARKGAVRAEGTPEELVVHLAAQSGQTRLVNRLVDALWKLEGAFSGLLATTDRLVAVRDPRGFKPLVLGNLDGAVLVASEDVAIRAVGGEVVREVEPGEMLLVRPGGVDRAKPFRKVGVVRCAQEPVQLARLGASVNGRSVWEVRHALGAQLAQEGRTEADVVVPVSGDDTPAAVGFAEATGLPWARGVLVAPGAPAGAGFSSAAGEVRLGEAGPGAGGLAESWFAVPDVVAGKRVVLVTRSMGSGRSLRRVVRAVRAAGAAQVHLRLMTPPLRCACPYGVLGPATRDLASQNGKVGPEHVGVESLRWLSRARLHAVLRTSDAEGLCDGCISGDLPLLPSAEDQLGLFRGETRRGDG